MIKKFLTFKFVQNVSRWQGNNDTKSRAYHSNNNWKNVNPRSYVSDEFYLKVRTYTKLEVKLVEQSRD